MSSFHGVLIVGAPLYTSVNCLLDTLQSVCDMSSALSSLVCVNFTANDYSVDEGGSVDVTLEVSGSFTGDIIVAVMAVIEADDTAGIMYGC